MKFRRRSIRKELIATMHWKKHLARITCKRKAADKAARKMRRRQRRAA